MWRGGFGERVVVGLRMLGLSIIFFGLCERGEINFSLDFLVGIRKFFNRGSFVVFVFM